MLAQIGVNNLSVFPIAGLVVFFAVFVAVSIRALRKPRKEIDDWARLPLDEPDAPATGANHEPRGA